ncbi:TPA: hypothetical protein ACH3X1_014910 [Trebouxia sp. C0004]
MSLPHAMLPSGHHLMDRIRARLVAYHDHHRGKPGSMFRRLAAARLKHLHTSESIRLDQKGVIYVIYNCKDDASGYRHDECMYVSLTHLSALQIFQCIVMSVLLYSGLL